MKQGRFVWKIIYALFAVFIVVYIIGTVWNTLYNPIKTVSAVYTTVENSIETEGFVIREERVIEAAYSGVAEMQLAEGERAAKGDAVAYIFANEAEVDKVHKRKELQERIDRLQMLMNQGNEVVD